MESVVWCHCHVTWHDLSHQSHDRFHWKCTTDSTEMPPESTNSRNLIHMESVVGCHWHVTWHDLSHLSHDRFHWKCTTDSTEIPPESTNLRILIPLVQIEIKPKSQFGFVLRKTEESEFLDLVDFGDVAFSVDSVMRRQHTTRRFFLEWVFFYIWGGYD